MVSNILFDACLKNYLKPREKTQIAIPLIFLFSRDYFEFYERFQEAALKEIGTRCKLFTMFENSIIFLLYFPRRVIPQQ